MLVMIATTDQKLALKLGAAIETEKSYLLRVTSGEQLVEEIDSMQPDVLVLDVKIGGNDFRALGELPTILDAEHEPAVIVVIPWKSIIVVREASRLGCFEVIRSDVRGFERRVSRAAWDAQAARLSGLLAPRRRSAGLLH